MVPIIHDSDEHVGEDRIEVRKCAQVVVPLVRPVIKVDVVSPTSVRHELGWLNREAVAFQQPKSTAFSKGR
eukprot:2224704-Prymnesium_polylepis.1